MSVGKQLAKQFLSVIDGAKSVLISTHMNPDGDALGSAIATSLFMDQRGIFNEIVCNNLAPYNLEFLPGVDRVRLEPETTHHDLGILLDLDSTDRLGKVAQFFEHCKKIIVIDHHVPHEAPGDLRIVDTQSPATALILSDLMLACRAEITPEMATCLLTGIVTDTGSFRYRNTTPESLVIAAHLLSHGGDIVRICEEVYQSKPLTSVRLLGKTLDHMQLAEQERLAWSKLAYKDFEETGASDEHTEGLVNELLAIRTVQIAFVLREPRPGQVRASLRSRQNYDVAAAVRPFGGGGHRNAAGCTFDVSIEEAEKLLVEALRECLASS